MLNETMIELTMLNLRNQPDFHKVDLGKINLELNQIFLQEDYRKKWNISLNDFMCLTKNGELISNSLYRIGGLNDPKLEKDDYFMLIKYVEAHYSDNITKIEKDKRHLEGRICIIDKNGMSHRI